MEHGMEWKVEWNMEWNGRWNGTWNGCKMPNQVLIGMGINWGGWSVYVG